MFSTRRLAKRSIVGTKVCAPWSDERYYPGVIQSTQTWPNGEDVYSVQFDDGYNKVCRDNEIIGPGFQTISVARLKKGQKVFVTHNGREISGSVIHHDQEKDEVQLYVLEDVGIERKLEEIRLMESRKSARLQDQDTDYSRMADLQVHTVETPKKRTVSSVIDVPSAKQRRPRSSSSSPEDREEEDMMCEDEDEEDIGAEVGTRGVMDTHMAAMVLTSLSCSPVSPAPFPTFNDKAITSPSPGGTRLSPSPGTGGSSVGSSGVWGMKGEPGTPSPPQFHMSSSAPTVPMFGSPPPADEGLELDDSSYFSDDIGPRKKRASVRTVFKCMWPGCGKIHNTIQSIEKHVRNNHLSPKEDSDLSDHEEEFYYQEVEVTVDTVTQTFADMYTSSPPQISVVNGAAFTITPLPDHDYQKKEPKTSPLNIPSSDNSCHSNHGSDTMYSPPSGASFPLSSEHSSLPISRSWQFTQGCGGSVKPSRSHDRLTQNIKSHSLSTSPKNSPMHKKSRSDVKKCRKVYGMENRDLWCTQCKWKKACTRFME